MKQQINFRASDLTIRQLAQLQNLTGMSQTELISTAVDRMYREENMNTTSKYDQARARMSEFEFTDEQMDFIFADWSEGEEHYDWLLTASKDEIEGWGEAANWGQVDDTVELGNTTICFLENPWSGTVSQMTWGEIKQWCMENVHESARKEWLREARKAAATGDSKTLGTMIIGS